MIQVIRIQDIYGTGIFRSKIVNDICCNSSHDYYESINDLHYRHNEFPTPQKDGLNMSKNYDSWYCAFKTIEQVQQWIEKEEISMLLDLGFNIFLLEVKDYQEGEFQVVYTKDSIKTKTNINSLFI